MHFKCPLFVIISNKYHQMNVLPIAFLSGSWQKYVYVVNMTIEMVNNFEVHSLYFRSIP